MEASPASGINGASWTDRSEERLSDYLVSSVGAFHNGQTLCIFQVFGLAARFQHNDDGQMEHPKFWKQKNAVF